jgi:hypothetical protein
LGFWGSLAKYLSDRDLSILTQNAENYKLKGTNDSDSKASFYKNSEFYTLSETSDPSELKRERKSTKYISKYNFKNYSNGQSLKSANPAAKNKLNLTSK